MRAYRCANRRFPSSRSTVDGTVTKPFTSKLTLWWRWSGRVRSMRDDDGRKPDHKTLEQLRIRAVGQIQQGAHPEDVAAALGMTRAAVYGWPAKYRWRRSRPTQSRDGRRRLTAPSGRGSTPWLSAMTPGSCSSRWRCGPAPWSGSSSAASSGCGCRRSAWAGCCASSAVTPASPVPGLAAEPGGGGALEGRDLSSNP
jgi:hypothetical protein